MHVKINTCNAQHVSQKKTCTTTQKCQEMFTGHGATRHGMTRHGATWHGATAWRDMTWHRLSQQSLLETQRHGGSSDASLRYKWLEAGRKCRLTGRWKTRRPRFTVHDTVNIYVLGMFTLPRLTGRRNSRAVPNCSRSQAHPWLSP